MPLGASRRAQPEIRAAEAELTALEIEREAKGLSLYSTLAEAHGRYLTAQVEVGRLRDQSTPGQFVQDVVTHDVDPPVFVADPGMGARGLRR